MSANSLGPQFHIVRNFQGKAGALKKGAGNKKIRYISLRDQCARIPQFIDYSCSSVLAEQSSTTSWLAGQGKCL
jgi:hypothetical protein